MVSECLSFAKPIAVKPSHNACLCKPNKASAFWNMLPMISPTRLFSAGMLHGMTEYGHAQAYNTITQLIYDNEFQQGASRGTVDAMAADSTHPWSLYLLNGDVSYARLSCLCTSQLLLVSHGITDISCRHAIVNCLLSTMVFLRSAAGNKYKR